MKFRPPPKRKRTDPPPPPPPPPSSSQCTPAVSSTEKKDTETLMSNKIMVHETQVTNVSLRIQQARNNAVAQAQQDGCTGNFKIFDSPFGNYLVPVIPTGAELGG